MFLSIALAAPLLLASAAQSSTTSAPQSAPAAPVPATAAAPAVTPAAAAKPAKDADPMICERFAETGSLLRSKKVCMRKSDWEEQRQQNQRLIERSQTQMPMNSGG